MIKYLSTGGLFALYVGSSCYGLYLLKAAPDWRTSAFFLGFLLYAFGALLWLVILRLTPLSLAFPVASGALIIGTLVTGMMFLNEIVKSTHLLGAGLIVLGIALITLNR